MCVLQPGKVLYVLYRYNVYLIIRVHIFLLCVSASGTYVYLVRKGVYVAYDTTQGLHLSGVYLIWGVCD